MVFKQATLINKNDVKDVFYMWLIIINAIPNHLFWISNIQINKTHIIEIT